MGLLPVAYLPQEATPSGVSSSTSQLGSASSVYADQGPWDQLQVQQQQQRQAHVATYEHTG
jgi:hypothetical protein